jgi:cell division protein ZapA (FtsZ GTPase activity inhibitor)
VGGVSYRLAATADEAQLQRYAAIVDERLRSLTPSGTVHPNGLVLVALSLVHELEDERRRRGQVEQRSRESLQRLLQRIDDALDSVDENGEPLPPLPVLESSV